MKKALIWGLVIVLGIGLIGSCAAGDTETDPNETTGVLLPQNTETESSKEQTAEATQEETQAPTSAPTTAPTTAPTEPPKQTEAKQGETQNMVWIPQSGKKYHSKANCSGMKDPSQVTQEEAEDMGYTPCKKCH